MPAHRLLALTAAVLLGIGGCGGGDDEKADSTTAEETASTDEAATESEEILGVTLAESEDGVVVESVQEESTNFKPGDLVTSVNGETVTSVDEAIEAIGEPDYGEPVELEITRGSKSFPFVVVPSPAAYLGAGVQDAKGGESGAVVVKVEPKGPAADAGIRVDDVIVALDGTPIGTVDDLLAAVAEAGVGAEVEFEVTRGSQELELSTTLAARPAGVPAS